MVRKLGIVVVAFLFMSVLVGQTYAKASVFGTKVNENTIEIAPQVKHIQQSYQSGSTNEFVNVLDINLSNTYTKLEMGLPNPYGSLKTTTNLARENSAPGHYVVGAVNASYFLGNGLPANLLAENNEIINYGIIGTSTESPTQQRVAFGIDKYGIAIADYYSTKLNFTVNGKVYPIDLINSERTDDKTVLYTPGKTSTGTNEWGVEIVVNSASQDMTKLHFGDVITGVVSDVTNYGVGGNSYIPSDGFVLSVQNKALATEIQNTIASGDNIKVSLSIDEQWMDAQYILAAGPLLVKNGQVNISMPTSSQFAKNPQPRTAVAIDSTGSRVFLVTIDGRQSHSKGASLNDLASYLISLGATSAINLDGGGSTTMVVRPPGFTYPSMVNKPSDGSERRVSAILQVVNTAPQGQVKSFKVDSSASVVVKDASIDLKVSRVYDEFLNPMTIDPLSMSWYVEGDIGTMNGATFTATKQGKGKIIGEYQGIRAEIAVEVISGDKPILLDSMDSAGLWNAKAAKATATIAASTKDEAVRQGSSSLRLNYDFTTADSGTKAAYASAKTPISIIGQPKNIGVWVFAEGGNHWLRGTVIDGAGAKHTIDFTSEGGLNWTGWKYVTADIPADITLPLKFEQIYVAQPTASLQNKGKIYFDQLQAVYKDGHQEIVYKDVTDPTYWAYASIINLNNQELIKGYVDGTFKPANTITRGEAATIIARALNLKATKAPNFSDVASNYYAYNAIAAVSEHGILTGREVGKFSPNGKLTRAETAAILSRAYKLVGTSTVNFKDINSSHWAYGNIQALVSNNLVSGYTDNTFRPNVQISRAEFAVFLDRAIQNKK